MLHALDPRACRLITVAAVFFSCLVVTGYMLRNGPNDILVKLKPADSPTPEDNKKLPPQPNYLPQPTWTPNPIKDPFPLLQESKPPPIPSWNRPKKDLHLDYGIDYAPPLFIGFTRTYPILLQAVVSYITAGWPPEQIYVIENTGVQRANSQGKLTLQNPFFLDYSALEKLGVNIIRTPVLMNFAQLQNFYTHLADTKDWPYYFWSHSDVLILSFEDGKEGVTPKAGEPGYKTVYELCLQELKKTIDTDDRWALRFFSYDHLTLVNRDTYLDLGGWDTFIPFYMTDCDMHSRINMQHYSIKDAQAGIVTDVSTVLDDFRAFYRDMSIEPKFTDPNPPPPSKRDEGMESTKLSASSSAFSLSERDEKPIDLGYWTKLRETANSMFHYKHGDRGRNTWQQGQQGGQGEPFYYPARGIAKAIDLLTETGREIYRQKWGHRDCDLVDGTQMKIKDIWLVGPDW